MIREWWHAAVEYAAALAGRTQATPPQAMWMMSVDMIMVQKRQDGIVMGDPKPEFILSHEHPVAWLLRQQKADRANLASDPRLGGNTIWKRVARIHWDKELPTDGKIAGEKDND